MKLGLELHNICSVTNVFHINEGFVGSSLFAVSLKSKSKSKVRLYYSAL